VHGVSIFFYWLFTTQTALAAGVLAACEDGAGLAWRPDWRGLALADARWAWC
jgi:hypothetical protein